MFLYAKTLIALTKDQFKQAQLPAVNSAVVVPVFYTDLLNQFF